MKLDKLSVIVLFSILLLSFMTGCTPPSTTEETPATTMTQELTPTQLTPTPVSTPVPTQTPTMAPTQTPTMVPTQTPTMVPTQTPTSPVLNTPELLFEDNFSNFMSGWPVTSISTEDVEHTYESGEYSILVKKSDWIAWVRNNSMVNPSDFAVEVEVRKVSRGSGESCGIVFREKMVGDKNNLYFFEIRNNDGTFRIRKLLNGNWNTLKNWKQSGYIKGESDSNRLKVVSKGTQIEVYANNNILDTINDVSLTEGNIGLAVESPLQLTGSHYHFDNFKLYSIPRWNVLSEQLLFKVDSYGFLQSKLRISLDGKRLAWIGVKEAKQWIIIDGIAGQNYDEVGAPIFSPNNKSVAYAARVGTKWFVVVDGVEGKKYDKVDSSSISYSPDSNRMAYMANINNKWLAVIDGMEGKQYDRYAGTNLVFTNDSTRVGYASCTGTKWSVVVDGVEGGAYDQVDRPVFSPDGKRVAYQARIENKWRVVVDGVEEKQYDDVSSLVFSPDSKKIAYWGTQGGNSFIVMNGTENKHYEGDFASPVVFSPDSNRLAYIVADKTGIVYVVVDGEEGKRYDATLRGTPLFSPDSKHLAYGATLNKQWFLVVDGIEGNQYSTIRWPIFSSDSQHLAYIAYASNGWTVIIDGIAGDVYSAIVYGDMEGSIVFESADYFHFLAMKEGDSIYLISGSRRK
jgi:roadblock/LC7 domain-containing protein